MSPRCITLILRSSDPAVFSRTAATEGAHSSFDAPTGSALLGWVAQNCYDEIAAAGYAHTIFHSGQVRFSNAVRFSDSKPGFARPETLLKPKQGGGDVVLGRAAFVAANPHDPHRQATEVDMLPVTLEGQALPDPAMVHRLRNSRKTDSLFGYEAIEVDDVSFRATIECDVALPDVVWNRVRDCFGSSLFLGRARGSGYGGGYSVEVDNHSPTFWPKPETKGARRVRVWLLSDACLTNAFGGPKLMLDAADVGLSPDWKPVPTESSAKCRRYAPWNRAINGRDAELSVIEAGAVFTFDWKGEGSPPVPDLSHLLGTRHERGLGRYAVIADSPAAFRFRPADATSGGQQGAPVAASSPLTCWAASRAEMHDKRPRDAWIAERETPLVAVLKQLGEMGPAPSQWWLLTDRQRVRTLLQRPEWQHLVAVRTHGSSDENSSFKSLAALVQEAILDRIGDLSQEDGRFALDRLVKIAREESKGLGR